MIGYVGARGDEAARDRLRNLAVALSFYLAVLLSFALLGVAAAYIGELLARWKPVFAAIAAGISFLAGLAMIFSPQLRRRLPEPEARRLGPGGAFVFGIVYSVAVVTTSTGPLLLLLAAAAAIGDLLFGALLAVAYAVGRGFPFLLLGIFGDWIIRWAARFARFARLAELVLGAGLVGLAIYLSWTAVRLA